MAGKTRSTGNQVSRISGTLQVVLWVIILVIAFFMQVVPFLLVLTMLNLAVGISSGTMLILVPAVAFAMLSFACWIATRRTRNMRPEPLPQPTYVAPYSSGNPKGAPLTTHQRIIPVLQRWRQRSL
jgi:hypothetical protein